jgi:hypothetical protein
MVRGFFKTLLKGWDKGSFKTLLKGKGKGWER